jgi:hypothetical protein
MIRAALFMGFALSALIGAAVGALFGALVFAAAALRALAVRS